MTVINTEIDSKWYALYTTPRAEKKTEQELVFKGFEPYLPLVTTLRQWSDRKKKVVVPLFPSYLFIKTNLEKNYYEILNTPGIVKFVRFGKEIATLREEQMQSIRLLLSNFNEIDISPMTFDLKSPVEVIAGPLKGTQGIITETRGNKNFAIEIEQLGACMWLTIPAQYLKKL